MDLKEFCRALKVRSDLSLRDSLDQLDWPMLESKASQEYASSPQKAFNRLIYEVETLKEMLRRLWDEVDGHLEVCRMNFDLEEEIKKFTQGFAYIKPKIEKGRWIDNDADDGWGLENLTKTTQQAREESMDKQIKKVEKDVKKGSKKKAMKDIKTLKVMDKKFDKKVVKAKKVMKKGC